MLTRSFYLGDAVTVAKRLVGKRLVHRTGEGETSGIIVETEAYAGHDDAACHSYRRTGPDNEHRTNIMFGKGGFAYVYLIYGMYHCFNVVANGPGKPEAVLIRAVQPDGGIELMQQRRKITGATTKLCNGPGKLCIAMGITRDHYGLDLCRSRLFITEGEEITHDLILATPRINVHYAGDAAMYPYRFVVRNSLFLSTKEYVG